MKARAQSVSSAAVIDPKCPWRLPRINCEFEYFYQKSVAEWSALLAKAAEGDAEAEYEVATVYDYGCKDSRGRILIRRSIDKAVTWYRRAAEHGSGGAQNNLGVILGGNHGVKRNAREALLWLNRAFRCGDTCCAPNNIAITYRENGKFRQAVRWFERCADRRDADVLIQLGIHYYWGKGVLVDHAFAVRLFRNAIKRKYAAEDSLEDAFFYLGIAYLEGNGVKKSLRMARKYFERANKDNDHPAAQRLLKQLKGIV
jgi:hypothetical protein